MSGSWPDVEAVVVAYLESTLAPVQAATSTPEDLEDRAFVKVSVSTGTDDGVNDRALADVQAFAPTREGARDLAEDCRAAMHALAGRDYSGDGSELIDSVTTSLRPAWVDYKNPRIHRFVASYWLTSRPQ